jgi:hypothetical protein
MAEYLEENDYSFEESKSHFATHLINFEISFKNRFPQPTLQQHEWMRNSFAVTKYHLPVRAKESVMELSVILLSR